MDVRVDEPGEDHAPAGVEELGAAALAGRDDRLDPAVAHDEVRRADALLEDDGAAADDEVTR